MNDITPVNLPPPIPPRPPASAAPLGDDPAEREAIGNPVVAIEAILRQPRRVMYQLRQRDGGKLSLGMLVASIICILIYGVVVGSFSKGDQLWAAPAKMAIGMLISAIICLPSLYIFTCLSGSQARLPEIFGLMCGLLLLTTMLLIGFAPVAWLFSESTNSIVWMGVLHVFFWFIATMFGLRFLANGFSHSHARSSSGLNTWIVVFVLVALQMTTALRPLIGTSKTFLPKEKKFFLTHWGDNLTSTNNAWSATNAASAARD